MKNTNQAIKVVLFDFNDVISPSNYLPKFKEHSNTLGMPGEQFAHAFVNAGLLDKLFVGGFASEHDFWLEVSDLTGVDIKSIYIVREDIAESKVVDHQVINIIDQLKGKYVLALFTENYKETFQYWLKKFNLPEKFNKIFNTYDYKMLKDNPKFYRQIIEELQVEPKEILMIDDNIERLEVAQSFAIKTIHFIGANELEKELTHLGILGGLPLGC
jgi:HAD superfamily hydrolase (TIGR01509 family)